MTLNTTCAYCGARTHSAGMLYCDQHCGFLREEEVRCSHCGVLKKEHDMWWEEGWKPVCPECANKQR